MRQIIIAAGIAILVSIMLTPVLIRVFSRQGFGQEIRDDGPQHHQKKRGTPSMGGVAILAGMWAGYFGSHLVGIAFGSDGPSASGLLVLALATMLGGVGFIDDFIKIRKARNLGLNKTSKTVGQILSALVFGVLVLQFRNTDGLTPGSPQLSYVREIATSHARRDLRALLRDPGHVLVQCRELHRWARRAGRRLRGDGDGRLRDRHLLAVPQRVLHPSGHRLLQRARPAGSGGHRRGDGGRMHRIPVVECRPAKIFMGDTGSLALGGVIAGLSVTTRTELLAVVLGHCSSRRSCRWFCRSRHSVPRAAGSFGWRPSIIISSYWGGPRQPSSFGFGY